MENTFTSIPGVVDNIYPFLRYVKWLALDNYWPSETRISDITCPILFISGEQDEMIPPEQMKRLRSLATSAKSTSFVGFTQFSVPGGDHNGTWQQNVGLYLKTIREFLEICIRARI